MMFAILTAHKNYYYSWLFHTAVCLGTLQTTDEGFCLGTPQSTDEGLSSKCMIKLQVQKHGPHEVLV